MKAKTLFITDIVVLLTLILSSFSGFMLHTAGHQDSHAVWHNWAAFHCFATLALTMSVGIHVCGHWNWYKSLFRNGLGNKSRVTVILTIVMIACIITGDIVLFRHQGPNSHLGLWHYIIGIILTAIALGHFFKRLQILIKGLRRKN